MTTVWVVIAALCVGTFSLRAIGPATLGTRTPPARALGVIALVAPAILAVYETFSDGHAGLTLDTRLVGLAVAAAAAFARLPMIVVVVLAARATAFARLTV